MQTILQVLIGVSPLILVSLYLLIRKRLFILPSIAVIGCAVVLVVGFFSWRDDSRQEEAQSKVISAGDYLYLAQTNMLTDNLDKAKLYIKKLYENAGDTLEGTLCNARIAALEEDYDGAKILYSKIESADGGEDVLTENDRKLIDSIDNGTTVNQLDAAGKLAEITTLKKSNVDITKYGYSEEQVEKLTQAATNPKSFKEDILNDVKDEQEKKKDDNEERCDNLEKSVEIVTIVNDEYDKYISNGSFDEDKVSDAVDNFDDIKSENDDLFSLTDIDEAYVKGLTLCEKDRELASYAMETGSQTALIATAQLLMDGYMSESELPDGFVTITEKQHKVVAAQCEETVKYLEKKDKAEGAALASLKKKVEAFNEMSGKLALAELDSRIDATNVNLEDQSKVYLGNSTINYHTGNTDAGDDNLGMSIETAPYSKDTQYSSSLSKVGAVINESVEDDEVKNTGNYIAEAYERGVINRAMQTAGNPADDSDDKAEDQSIRDTMISQGTTYVSKKKAMINIAGVDISNFPEVTFNLQTAKELDLDNLQLKLRDCNISIEDFEIEKIDYDSSKIYMVCDKSGSMEGSDKTLQEAVRSFASSLTDKEKIALIGFSDNVEFSSELTGNPDDLEEYIDRLVAGGGTNVASGAFEAVNSLAGSKDSFNVVIVMTDGEDSSFDDSNLKELAKKCKDNNIVLYTIGLGNEVHPEYLTNIAKYGDGKFVYCYDVTELEALYAFIHGQVENNYKVTFTAKDTVTNYRDINVVNNADSTDTTKTYTLRDDEEQTDENGNFIVNESGIKINGIDNKKIYKTNADVTVSLSGSGFKEDMSISVSIKGDAYKGTFTGSYVSDTQASVVIPSQVPAGEYEVEINVGGCVAQDKVEVLIPGKLQSIQFGAYTFSALDIQTTDGITKLNGDVSMNDFLHFNGTITLTGDLEKDTKVTLNDQNGYYIAFTKKMPGLLGKMCGNALPFMALGDLVIYNDQAHVSDLDNYMVDTYTVPTFGWGALIYRGTTVGLYPHKLSLVLGELTFDFPLQEQIFKYAGGENPFKASATAEGLINNSGLYVKGNASLSDLADQFNFSVMSFGLDTFAVEFDTYNNDYKLTLKVKTGDIIPSIADDDADDAAYGFDVAFKGGRWDAFNIYADFPVTVAPTPPVTLSGFFVGLSDLSATDQGAGFAKTLLMSTFTGGCDVSVAKVSDMIPALDAVFGDLSLITFEESTLKFSVGNLKIEVSTTAKLLGEIECGDAKVKLGKYDHEDYLLGISEKETAGIYLETNVGPKLDVANIKASVQGTTIVALNTLVGSLRSAGDVKYDVNLIKHFKNDINGTFEMAFLTSGELVLLCKGGALENNAQTGFKLTFKGWKPSLTFY